MSTRTKLTKGGTGKRKKNKTENSIELQKPNIQAEVYNNNRKCDFLLLEIYTYMPIIIIKIKTVQQK